MNNQQSVQTVLTLGNANELVNNIVRGVLGNDVADTFQGSVIGRSLVYNMVQAHAQAKLAAHVAGA